MALDLLYGYREIVGDDGSFRSLRLLLESCKSLVALYVHFGSIIAYFGGVYNSNVVLSGSVDDRRSTFGYCTLLGGNLVTWRRKKQYVVSRSSVEAEYRTMAQGFCPCSLLGQNSRRIISSQSAIGSASYFQVFILSSRASIDPKYSSIRGLLVQPQEAEELFETISQALLASVDRNCLSGWGGDIFVV
ncbi:proteasome subunit beta type-3-like [Macadamia integrifolia]|uniref:proteasome subunit beta type-3-like n=1 Tax=Macadamia integrifolia TaxID=60698 RepID=UPI001C4F6362|nr:proteasome subunit beta type-3-like [Macadamia integrifolia]